MFKLIKSIFGLSRPRRTESEEPKSKLKLAEVSPSKKVPSLDSKNKAIQTNKRKNPSPQSFFELDEVNTIKKTLRASIKDTAKIDNINLDMVSDLNSGISEGDEEDYLLSGLTGEEKKKEVMYRSEMREIEREVEGDKKDEIFTFFPEKQTSKRKDVLFESEMPNEVKRSKKIHHNLELKVEKILVDHQNPIRKPLKLKLQCPFCSKPLEKQTSQILACSHRFHQSCAVKMRERNRFDCDLCQIKRKNLCSMILLDRRKNRSYSRPNMD